MSRRDASRASVSDSRRVLAKVAVDTRAAITSARGGSKGVLNDVTTDSQRTLVNAKVDFDRSAQVLQFQEFGGRRMLDATKGFDLGQAADLDEGQMHPVVFEERRLGFRVPDGLLKANTCAFPIGTKFRRLKTGTVAGS
jgi:hypothetical protein